MREQMNNFWIKGCAYVATILVVTLAVSCEDVFENNISDENVTLVFPLANDTVKTSEVTFDWKKVEGAESYRLQVNDENSKRVLDTLVETTFFPFGLESGEYTWRIRAENFAYQTAYTFPTTFRVEAADDLTTQTVVLTSPSNNFYINSASGVKLQWEKLRYADSYNLSLDKKKTSGTETLDIVTGITGVFTTIDASYLDEDAEYVWKVQAVNESSQSVFSSRSILLDTKLPVSPVQSSPVQDQPFEKGSVTFSWTVSSDVGTIQSPIHYVLEIASDEAITQSVIVYDNVTSLSQVHNFNSAGEFYWRVKSVDLASNESVYSEARKFIVN